ncbi:conserved hypothetical protein [Vibrio owensii]|uniref:TRAFAC clade GTPase domain-containing protein n=1 Tax=Vibrio harveyi group TaxID=717610 RepID=UPI0005EEEE8C|nr:hypothetical protein [Vibrio campbellii]CAH1522135.1 conserved hypothetical protein [Vibrio owensii]CAH1554177.1 conserved hypothetical protein [Vibrio owensii]
MTDDKKIVFCGLPESGKTTFLGALSYLAESNDSSNTLKLEGLQEQRHFFNLLADTWVDCKPMMRTKVDSQEFIEMTLSSTDLKFNVEMPDLSGETWASIWSEHEISPVVYSFLNQSSSLAFFIHVDQISTPLNLSEENSMLQGSSRIEPHSGQLDVWDANKHASTQAVTVDLLIKASSMMKGANKRVAIILSAWDTVSPDDQDPQNFINTQMPLLYQYLSSRLDFHDFKIYGVSAQGGCLNEQKDSLLDIDNPTHRIKVIEVEGTQHHDLTKILSWLVNE